MLKSNSVRENNRQTKKHIFFNRRFFEIFGLDVKINNLWRQEVYTFDVSNLFYDLQYAPAKAIVASELKLTLRNSSQWVHIVLKTWKRSECRRLQNEDGVENALLGLQIVDSFCFARSIILFWKPRCRDCRVVDLKLPIFAQLTSQPDKNEKVAHETETPFTL